MRIGFLAMSGVRACDPYLLELGLTLPGFVSRSRTIASLPSLGLLLLAACTPPGHELRYFEAEAAERAPPELFACDLVAISTFTAQVKEAYAVADRLRTAGVLVAMGGIHVTCLPEEAAEHADYVVVGEGETVWPEVVTASERRAPPTVFSARAHGPVQVEDLPIPRYDLLAGRAYNRFTVQSSRGCPWHCDFCASGILLEPTYRVRPVAHVLRDIAAIRTLRPHPFLEFADDNTFVRKEWGRELCRALEPLRLRWFTETDLSVADDPELLRALRRAGCRQVLIGLESPAQEGVEGVELRANWKASRAGAALTAVRRIQAEGITVNGCFILGLDGDGPEVFEGILEFAESAPLYEVQITVLTPFPGTPLYSRLAAEGRLLTPGAWERCTLFDVNFQPRKMSPAELRAGLYHLTETLYSRQSVQRRRRAFLEQRRRLRCRN